MRISGSGGEVRVGHQVAARLGDWTLTRTRTTPEPEYDATATVVWSDSFWRQQRPMRLELAIGNRRWGWSDLDPVLGEQSLAAVLVGGPAIH